MNTLILLLMIACVAAIPQPFQSERIVGGELTTIDQYPFQAALLQIWFLDIFSHLCGASILNARSILTAAHCFMFYTDPRAFRVRVGSTYANSGGITHDAAQVILHPDYNPRNLDCDVAIVRTASIIVHNQLVQPIMISGPGYNLPDNDPVVALGWGHTTHGGVSSEQLRDVHVWTVNQAICRTRYMELEDEVTNNMLCSGWLDVGGRDQCQGDSGGPLVHNGVLVGVCSWGEQCALARYPGVNARVSRFSAWIQANA